MIDILRGLFAYVVSTVVASALYVCFLTVFFFDKNMSISEAFNQAQFAYLIGGFMFAFVVLPLPWICAVKMRRTSSSQKRNAAYFILAGAFWFFCLNCVTWDNLLDTTYMTRQQMLYYAVRSEGLFFLACGAAFGATYWFFAARRRPEITKASPVP